MVYIQEHNVEFYDSLPNKSEFINHLLQREQKGPQSQSVVTAPAEDEENDPNWHPDPRIRETRRQIAAMEARDKANVAKNS